MENASKALIMAGGMLLAILIISLLLAPSALNIPISFILDKNDDLIINNNNIIEYR